MKKSGLIIKAKVIIKAKDKMNLFRSGRSKPESCISKEPGNIEYRFLRFIIQQYAPKIVKYRNEAEGNGQLIHAIFIGFHNSFSSKLLDHSKTSMILKTPQPQFPIA
jgi:hypothetical protein